LIVIPDLADPAILPFYLAAMVVAGSVILGGRPERWGFGVLAAMLVFQIAGYSVYEKPRFDQLDLVALGADVICLCGFLMLLRNAERVWPILAVMMAMLSLLGHFARVEGTMLDLAYLSFQSGPTMVILATLPIAVAAHRWRLWKRGFDRDWTPLKTDRALRKAAKRVALQKNYTRGRAKTPYPRVGEL